MILNTTNFYFSPIEKKSEFVKVEIRVRVMDTELQ